MQYVTRNMQYVTRNTEYAKDHKEILLYVVWLSKERSGLSAMMHASYQTYQDVIFNFFDQMTYFMLIFGL